jgi:predicted nucleotidyltransferase
MTIFEKVRELNLPIGEYVVVGSGIMEALGIKKANDVDLVVTPDLFKKLAENGWKSHARPNGEHGLQKGIASAYLDVNCGDCNPTTGELLKESLIIDGIPFITLKRLMCFKNAYAREKDFKDIELIKNYLNNKNINLDFGG